MIAAIDLGYGWTKAWAGGRVFLEPSVVGPAGVIFEGLGAAEGVRVWDADGQEFFVGRLASQQSAVQWHTLGDKKVNDNTMRLLQAALAFIAPQPNGVCAIDLVVTGLPVNLWATQRVEMEQMLQRLNGASVRARIGRANLDLMLTVKEVRVLAQPFGSFLDAVLDEQGHLIRKDIARTLVLDVGFHTVDWLTLDGMAPINRLSGGTNFGLATAWAAVGKSINRPVWEVDQLFVEGRLTGVEPHLKSLADNVSGSIESLNEKYDLCLVTGGGGKLLYPYLRLPGRVELVADPQFGNVRGYWKAGQRLSRRDTA